MQHISIQTGRLRALLAAIGLAAVLATALTPQVAMGQKVSGGSIRGSNAASAKGGSGSGSGDLESITANGASKAKTIMGTLGAVLAGAVMLWAFFIERSAKLVGLAALGCVIGGLAISGGLWEAGSKTGNDLLNSSGAAGKAGGR